MALRYELFLRAAAPLGAEQLEQLTAEAQQQQLELEPFRSEGELQGIDIGVDPEQHQAAERLCDLAFCLAKEHSFSVYDPQLGRSVVAAEQQDIAQRMQRSAAHALSVPLTTAGLSSASRLWLWVLALVVGVLLLSKLLTCFST